MCACVRARAACAPLWATRRACVCPSKLIHKAAYGPIGTKLDTQIPINLERVVGKIKISPVRPRGILGVLEGKKFKNLKKVPNGWTGWHQMWHTCSDLSGNGHKLNKIVPRDSRGAFGGFRVLKINKYGKSTKWLD